MLIKALNAGEAHGHLKRISDSKITNSETIAPKYFLFKDHKLQESWRPVVSGCTSNTLGLSNLLSDVVESLCCSISDPFEVISGEDLLSRIEVFNKFIKEKNAEKGDNWDYREEMSLVASDVVSLSQA